MFENENHLNAFTQHGSSEEAITNTRSEILKNPKEMNLDEINAELMKMGSDQIFTDSDSIDYDRKEVLLKRKSELEN